MGKIGKFYKENCLLDQEFVKDNKINIKQYTQNTAKELGGSIEIKKFVRFEKGEGIEKRQDDFAAEVASMVKYYFGVQSIIIGAENDFSALGLQKTRNSV